MHNPKLDITNPGYVDVRLRSSKGAASYLTRRIDDSLRRGQNEFKITLIEPDKAMFPNICVPLAGIIQYYKSERDCTFLGSKSLDPRTYAGRLGLLNPYYDTSSVRSDCFLDRIWEFDESNHFQVVSGIVSSLRQATPMAKGLLNGLEICLNEVTDNVLLHAGKEESKRVPGYVMAQIHRTSNKAVIAVYDYGIGLAESLRLGGIETQSQKEAIELALQQGITDGYGAGNGLWMLDSIVRLSHGSFEVGTGGVVYSCRHQQGENITISTAKARIPRKGTTSVDFQLDLSRDFNLESVMSPGGYTDLWLESHEDLTNSERYIIRAIDDSNGFGSRHDAFRFANTIINTSASTGKAVTVDFSDIEVLSMSFADELLVSLISHFGFLGFINRIRLTGLNPLCVCVINSVMNERLKKANS